MIWTLHLFASAACLIASVVFAVVRANSRYKRGRLLDPIKFLLIGVVVSSVILFIPIYMQAFRDTNIGVVETLLVSIHNMIRLFIVDGDFNFITDNLVGVPDLISRGYIVLFSILFVMAPVLTFGFALSFFRNLSAYKKYFEHFFSDVYIFSELNEKSLALAKSLYHNNRKKRFFVFTNVSEKEDQRYNMIEEAKELGAVLFKNDIVTVDFSFHSKRKSLNLFTIGENQSENVNQALKLIDELRNRDNTNLFVLSTQVESEILLANAFVDSEGDKDAQSAKIKVRRVNEVQSLITRNLYEKGYDLIFRNAHKDGSGTDKINAVVIGMGQHGTEMTKALSWFCQMDNYEVRINSFDIDKNAMDKFVALCPELMDVHYNGNFNVEGEAKYIITVHSGIDVDTATFERIIKNLPVTTYVFVALGNDEKNIAVAMRLRAMFCRMGCNPQIQAVVYNTEKKEALNGITNFKKQDYNIDFIGDIRDSYSEEVILNSAVEEKALKRHLLWGAESEFWQYDYNYKSSVASAIHKEMKLLCGIPGIEKEPDARSDEERKAIRNLEHCRWNAYMRSEGYVYGGTVEKSGRNDMAKMHNFLVPFEELPLKQQEKDDD